MVEELLKLFIAEVDAELLETIELEDFEPSNIQDADEGHLLHRGIDKSLIALLNQKVEHATVDSPRNPPNGRDRLVYILPLGHPLCANLYNRGN